jgi:hypothetical protein
MNPYAALDIARQRQADLLRDARHRRLAASARDARRAADAGSVRASLGLLLVRVGARVAGEDAVVLAAPVLGRR